jgi:hypothetical protein
MSLGWFSSLIASQRARKICRAFLFIYSSLILSPIQYWAPNGTADNTWILAINYAAAHHMVMGRDILWPAGPLGYLAAPMDIGNNLAMGLICQAVLWLLLIAILADLFYRGGFALRNLTFFSIFLGLSGPLYHHLPNPLGAGDLLLVGAFILIVHFHLRGGAWRYITALFMLGLVPLVKFVGVMLAAGTIAGLLVDWFVRKRWAAWREVAITVALPLVVSSLGYWFTLGSFQTIALYFKGSIELSKGYNLAMAKAGPPLYEIAGAEALGLVAVALTMLALRNHRCAIFLSLLMAAAVLLNGKHSFVREDSHIIYTLSFSALATALIALVMPIDSRNYAWGLALIAVGLGLLCQDYAGEQDLITAVSSVSGVRVPIRTARALWLPYLREWLREPDEQKEVPAQLRVEPEIQAIIQHEPVSSLSISYSGVFVDGLNLTLYPVVQRYTACTPYLDERNAEWVRNRGPRFLILNGNSMTLDGRHPWTETPAMWAEIYRWYNTRALGSYTLLLERRTTPRFTRFDLLGHSQLRFGEELKMPASTAPVLWSMRCSLTRRGRTRALLFRVDEVTMTVNRDHDQPETFRVLPEVLVAPSLGSHLPNTLQEFAETFKEKGDQDFSVRSLSFGGPGSSDYAPICDVDTWQGVP